MLGAGRRRLAHERVIELDAADEQHARIGALDVERRSIRPFEMQPRDAMDVDARRARASSHGNRRSARVLTPPPHGLLRGNAARSTSSVLTPAAASVRAATAPAGPAPATMTW